MAVFLKFYFLIVCRFDSDDSIANLAPTSNHSPDGPPLSRVVSERRSLTFVFLCLLKNYQISPVYGHHILSLYGSLSLYLSLSLSISTNGLLSIPLWGHLDIRSGRNHAIRTSKGVAGRKNGDGISRKHRQEGGGNIISFFLQRHQTTQLTLRRLPFLLNGCHKFR